ncbi:MAG: hypothetical protein KTR35_13195 [Gammaproteobacteria bacterium]|nr:hypothetical protein [Gammaproteobacteria bacterium]
MILTTTYIGSVIQRHWRRLLFHGVLVAVMFQFIMLIALIVRFQAFPNYVHFHDWLGNIARIIASTPSWSDILRIAREEWLIEIGQMNYDYGTGLSIWSLNVIPSRLLVLTGMGAMVSLCLLMAAERTCAISRRSAKATLMGGSLLVAMTNATMSWVVCCATPSWVVGLAMLGLSVSASLALESMGPLLSTSGFSLLLLSVFFIGWRTSHALPNAQTNIDPVSGHA